MEVIGRVRWFDHDKGYGMVDCPEQKIQDVLCHKDVVKNYEQVKDKLVPGVRLRIVVTWRARAASAELAPDDA